MRTRKIISFHAQHQLVEGAVLLAETTVNKNEIKKKYSIYLLKHI